MSEDRNNEIKALLDAHEQSHLDREQALVAENLVLETALAHERETFQAHMATHTPVDNGRRVFAHYFPPYPISIDNKLAPADYYGRNYLPVDGESGKHAAYGGLLRDRPIPRNPLGPDYKEQDLRTEVRQAKSAGIDGFTLNVMGISGSNWDLGIRLMQAAKDEGEFVIVPNLDGNGSGAAAGAVAVAAKLALLYAYSSAWKVGEDFVLSSFKADAKSVAWWTQLIFELENTHKIPIKFLAVFLSASEANMRAYAPICWAQSVWGNRHPRTIEGAKDYVALAKSIRPDLLWMGYAAPQDYRPHNVVFAEAENTQAFALSWAKNRKDGAAFVQVITWNDYSENTQVAPSVGGSSAWLDLTAFNTKWFKTGVQPVVAEPLIVLTHRLQHHTQVSTTGIPLPKATLDGGGVPRSLTEAFVVLPVAGMVSVNGGVPVSVSAQTPTHVTWSLNIGKPNLVSVTGQKEGPILLTSPHQTTATPAVPDMQYKASVYSSGPK